MSRPDLSNEAKQTFQVLGMLATILVVGIHYKSDIPNVAELSGSTWNELGQEFVFGGLARIAVPVFAFAAGLFYFRSDDGSPGSYSKKLKRRIRTVLLPYLIVGLVATVTLYVVKRLEGSPFDFSPTEFLVTWTLHPPAEQLWFLRDLLLLVLIAPVIRFAATNSIARWMAIPLVAGAWISNWQFSPVVEGWYLIHVETLFFFLLGCFAVGHYRWIESAISASNNVVIAVVSAWVLTALVRVTIKPNFDLWYTNEWGVADLLLHQGSILIGCVALLMISSRLRFRGILFLSGASFFVYLVHEFPLRAIVERVAIRVVPEPVSCWFITPLVVIGCFSLAIVMFKFSPKFTGILSGGRGPTWSKLPIQTNLPPRALPENAS